MESFSIAGMWESTGLLARIVLVILGSMSVYSLYVSFERIATFMQARKGALRYVVGLEDLLERRDIDGALLLSKTKPQPPIARVVGAALEEYVKGMASLRRRESKGAPSVDLIELVQLAIVRVKERELADLKRGLSSLASIAAASPFIGLFGTVVGIIDAFQAMSASRQGGIGAISAGIAEALTTTAFGLLVAIPAVLLYNHLTGRVEDLVVDMNDVSSEVIAFVLRDGGGASGDVS